LRIASAAPRAGLVGGLLLICCAVMVLLQTFNFGTIGTSATDASADTPPAETSLAKTSPAKTSPATPRSLNTPNDPTAPGTAELSLAGLPVLTVLIDERSYRVQVPAEPEPLYRDCSLELIRTLANTTTGDSNGIRVRILRRETARQSAETALQQTLEQAGITIDAILMPSETVP
ncbi:MAG: hypothetical protein ACKO2P_19475, partial [Planctomycetota bacterium]